MHLALSAQRLGRIALVLFAGLGAAPAITPDEAHRQTEAARRALELAEQKLADAGARATRADLDLKALIRKQDNLADDYRRAQSEVDANRRQVAAAEIALPDAQRQADAAAKEAGDRRDALTDARRKSAAASDEIRKTTDALTAEFHTSDPFKRAESEIVEKQTQLEAAKARRLSLLETEDAYRTAKEASDRAEAAVKAERDKTPSDAGALAAASSIWIEAKGKLETLKLDAYAKDPDTIAANEALKAAKSARDAMQSAFQNSLTDHPRLAGPNEKLQQAKVETSQLTVVVDRAEKTAARLSQTLRNIQNGSAAAKENLATAQTRAESLRGQIQLLPTTVNQMIANVRLLRTEETNCRRARDAAAQTLKDMILQEQQANAPVKKK